MKRKKEYTNQPTKRLNQPEIKQSSIKLNWKYYFGLAFVIIITFIVYLPVLQNGLLGWDDDAYITNNPLIYTFGLNEIFSHYVLGNYHPITILILAIEYHFFGLNATGYHAVNLLIHLLNVILVFYAIFHLSRHGEIALVVSLLFGIHPIHVESVAWASELKDLLYTFFFLASYIFYLKYLKELSRKYYVFAVILFLVSLLSKAMAASLPALLILTDYFMGRKINRKVILEKAPFFILAIAFGVVAILAQKSADAVEVVNFPFFQRIIFASYGYISYLIKLIIPLQLCAFYPYPITNGENIPIMFFLYPVVTFILIVSVFYTLKFSRKVFFGVAFFSITIFLVLQLLPVGEAIMADRYSYLPSIGIFYLAAEGFYLLWSRKLKYAAVAGLVLYSIFLSVKTYSTCSNWKDDLTLWNDVISKYQTIPKAYDNRGVAYSNKKEYDKALENHNKAIELNPKHTEAFYNRGVAFFNKNEFEKAIKDYTRAIELNPKHAKAYFNRGISFASEKKFESAFKDYNKAIELNPNYSKAIVNRGYIYYNNKEYHKAIVDFSKAIELRVDGAIAFYYRGLANYYLGKKDLACVDWQQAASLGYKPASEAYIQICK